MLIFILSTLFPFCLCYPLFRESFPWNFICGSTERQWLRFYAFWKNLHMVLLIVLVLYNSEPLQIKLSSWGVLYQKVAKNWTEKLVWELALLVFSGKIFFFPFLYESNQHRQVSLLFASGKFIYSHLPFQ